jgi:hypothetical protein
MLTKLKVKSVFIARHDSCLVIREQLRALELCNGRLVHVNDALTTVEGPFRVVQYKVKSSY